MHRDTTSEMSDTAVFAGVVLGAAATAAAFLEFLPLAALLLSVMWTLSSGAFVHMYHTERKLDGLRSPRFFWISAALFFTVNKFCYCVLFTVLFARIIIFQ